MGLWGWLGQSPTSSLNCFVDSGIITKIDQGSSLSSVKGEHDYTSRLLRVAVREGQSGSHTEGALTDANPPLVPRL